MKRLRTSPLWWLGFGMTIEVAGSQILIKKGHRKAQLNKRDLTGSRAERRTFRGWTLVVSTIDKPIYFGHLNQREALKASAFIDNEVSF